MIPFAEILDQLKHGNLSVITDEVISRMNSVAFVIYQASKSMTISPHDLSIIKDIIEISNILDNNTDMDKLPLDNGVYDLLLELYKSYNPNFLVGAIPVEFAPTQQGCDYTQELRDVYRRLDSEVVDNFVYKDQLLNFPVVLPRHILKTVYKRVNGDGYISKRTVDIKHNYPKLVGSLDKYKFVLSSEAIDKGVFDDANVKIFERDFIGKHISSRIITSHRRIKGIAGLKYDGISVEADVSNVVIAARSRGDANEDLAADLTPILAGYRFPKCPLELWNKEPIGMKFEAIMTRQNLAIYNKLKGKSYKNCRTAIIGLFGSSDGYKYRDLITLVPLATSLEDITRLEEIEFMNKYYAREVNYMYMYFEGDYVEVLFQVKTFVQEAEFMRHFIPFMYDGVVVEYLDEDLIKALGRVNSINKYAAAIKFTPLKVLTIFRGYDYTIGQYGTVTPMIYFDPVEFFGSIHNHASGHSYERFKNLDLRVGDVVEAEYSHDVMCYITKPVNSHNTENSKNPPVAFITECPCCGTKLLETDSGKNMYCPNIKCDARNLKRMVNMIKKLNLKDFAEARIESIGAKSLRELFILTLEQLEMYVGEAMAIKLFDRINDLKTKPIKDYDMIGTLGFESIGRRKFKLLFAKYTLQEIYVMDDNTLRLAIVGIKGLGPSAADTIISQMEFFMDDIYLILGMTNIVSTKGTSSGKIIRFSGFRDKGLVQTLQSMGLDADDSASITMKTDILLVPYLEDVNGELYTSTKTAKASEYNQKGANIQIVSVIDFMDDFDKYL